MAEDKGPSEEELQRFQQLRQEQRLLAIKMTELEADRNEHKIVVEALSQLAPDRRCFRMVGGVLVERTVGEVLPALRTNMDKVQEVLEKLEVQLKEKGRELLELRDKHNIRFQGESVETVGQGSKPASQGVLVEK